MSINGFLRIASSVILMPVVVYIWYQGGWLFALLALALVVLASLEYAMMTSGNRWNSAIVLSPAIAFATALSMAIGSLPTVGLVVVGAVVLLAIAQNMSNTDKDGTHTNLKRLVPLWLLTMYVGFVGGCAILLRWHEGGILWWLLIISVTWSMDTLSYAAGRTYGKRPLAPRLSLSKTLEGAATGIIGAIVISFFFLIHLNALLPLTGIIAAGGPFFALMGDLLESGVKRRYKTKDSRLKGFNLLPGHGGLLDRIDGLMMVIVYTFIVVAVFMLW